MGIGHLDHLDVWDFESGALNVIIETAKGSRNKYKYEPATGGFELHKVLPSGMAFPFDFGFIPSTIGEDGDPLDVMVFMDEPAFTGCRIPCRLIGVIEGQQNEDGRIERNDRLLAVAKHSHDQNNVHSFKDLNEHMLEEVEQFFVSYHSLDKADFKPLGRHGPKKAEKLIQEGVNRFRKTSKRRRQAHDNGKMKVGKA